MKQFGYHTNQLYFNMRAPNKVKYIMQKDLGAFEIPKHKSTNSITELHKEFKAKTEWEKYLNPKGLKPTITSRFTKPVQEQDFVSH